MDIQRILCRSKTKCIRCGAIQEVNVNCTKKCIHYKSEKQESNDKKLPKFHKNFTETMAFANGSYYDASLLVQKWKKEETSPIAYGKLSTTKR